METNKIPFSFYDNIAILFPGAVLMGLILYYFPEANAYAKSIKAISDTLLVFIFIIASFIGGHITYVVSRAIAGGIDLLTDKFLCNAFRELPVREQDKIIEYIGIIYKTDFNLKGEMADFRNKGSGSLCIRVKNLCFSLVKDKIANYYIFMPLADFLRSISLLISLIWVTFVFDICIFRYYSFGISRDILLLTCLLIAAYLVYKRSLEMRKLADNVVYSQFLFEASVLKSETKNVFGRS